MNRFASFILQFRYKAFYIYVRKNNANLHLKEYNHETSLHSFDRYTIVRQHGTEFILCSTKKKIIKSFLGFYHVFKTISFLSVFFSL